MVYLFCLTCRFTLALTPSKPKLVEWNLKIVFLNSLTSPSEGRIKLGLPLNVYSWLSLSHLAPFRALCVVIALVIGHCSVLKGIT